MSILILAEHDNQKLNAATLPVISAAKEIGGEILLLIAGFNSDPVAEQASRVQGIDKVLHANDAAYEHGLAENIAAVERGEESGIIGLRLIPGVLQVDVSAFTLVNFDGAVVTSDAAERLTVTDGVVNYIVCRARYRLLDSAVLSAKTGHCTEKFHTCARTRG